MYDVLQGSRLSSMMFLLLDVDLSKNNGEMSGWGRETKDLGSGIYGNRLEESNVSDRIWAGVKLS